MPKPHKKSASEEQLHSDGHSRRAFLLRLGAAGVAATARPLSGLARSPESKTGQGDVQNNLPGLIPERCESTDRNIIFESIRERLYWIVCERPCI